MKKENHYVLRGTIEVLSGVCIGGSDDVLQIGGTDLTCIKDPVTGKPYIPGSSLKGRMRSCLEKHLDKTNNEKPCGCARADCPICRLFGPHMRPDHDLGPTRIIVRDAHLLGDQFALENKTESVNRRDTGAARDPRTVERVAPGARFALEIAMQEYDIDRDFAYPDVDGKTMLKGKEALWAVVYHAIELVEQTGIGAGTSKGYGKVRFHLEEHIQICGRKRRPADFAASGDAC